MYLLACDLIRKKAFPQISLQILSLHNLYFLSRLQLRVLSLFQTPVLGPGLRLVANKLMRLNIFLATDWEPQILQVVQPGSHATTTFLCLSVVSVLF